MKTVLSLLVVFLLLCAPPALASQAEAREVARMNNCMPKKVEIYEQKIASDIQTIYQIECNIPNVVGANASPMASSLLVLCHGSLCRMLRPVNANM